MRFIKGLLSEPPAVALQLDDFAEDLYSDDRTGMPIEDLIPDYSILDQIEYITPSTMLTLPTRREAVLENAIFAAYPNSKGTT